MSFFTTFVNKYFKKEVQPQQPLTEDLDKAAQWASENLEASGYQADYSLDSLKDLDRFFETERTGLLAEHEDKGIILFTLGAYLGQVALKAYGGSWQADDKDPQAELHVTLVLANGQAFQPVQACISRYQYAKSQSLHTFVTKLGQLAAKPKPEETRVEEAKPEETPATETPDSEEAKD